MCHNLNAATTAEARDAGTPETVPLVHGHGQRLGTQDFFGRDLLQLRPAHGQGYPRGQTGLNSCAAAFACDLLAEASLHGHLHAELVGEQQLEAAPTGRRQRQRKACPVLGRVPDGMSNEWVRRKEGGRGGCVKK